MKVFLVILTVLTTTSAGKFRLDCQENYILVFLMEHSYLVIEVAASLARLPLSVFLDSKLTELTRTKRQGRIIGGTNAKEGEFPWMVRKFQLKKSSSFQPMGVFIIPLSFCISYF